MDIRTSASHLTKRCLFSCISLFFLLSYVFYIHPIGHFQVAFCLCVKTSLNMRNHSYDLHLQNSFSHGDSFWNRGTRINSSMSCSQEPLITFARVMSCTHRRAHPSATYTRVPHTCACATYIRFPYACHTDKNRPKRWCVMMRRCMLYVTRMFSYVFVFTRILLVCTRKYSYALVCTRMYSYVLVCNLMLIVCTRMCHARMLLVCTRVVF